jgi:hypothetical protein
MNLLYSVEVLEDHYLVLSVSVPYFIVDMWRNSS